MDLGLKGKVVVVTGGASGIGRAAVRGFAQEGAIVTALDRDRDALDRLEGEIEGVEGRVADVTDREGVAAAIDAVVERHGRLDVAVNNAGITTAVHWMHDFPEDEWDRVTAVNLKGVWLSMRAELRHMHAQGSGVIVNTASAAALVGAPGTAPYTAAKHGVVGLTRTAALEYAPLGIRINAIAPGTVDTPMSDGFSASNVVQDPFADALVRHGHPLKPLAQAEEIADAILYLAGDRSSFATGSVLVLDGGLTAQ